MNTYVPIFRGLDARGGRNTHTHTHTHTHTGQLLQGLMMVNLDTLKKMITTKRARERKREGGGGGGGGEGKREREREGGGGKRD